MADHITISPIAGPVTARAGEVTLGKSHDALELCERRHAPVIYMPRSDIDMGKLERSAKVTTCPHKGVASYYSVRTAAGILENAVWSYETPLPTMARIAGHLAFYPNKATVTKG